MANYICVIETPFSTHPHSSGLGSYTTRTLAHTRRWTDAKAANGYSMDGSVETKFKPTTEKWAGDKAGAGPEEEDTVASEDLK